MLRSKVLCGLAALALVTLALGAMRWLAEQGQWEKLMDSAKQAYDRADYRTAEMLLKQALSEAEKFRPEAPRLGTSLNNLAELYSAQGKYAEAEPLYRRALAITEKALGPEHPNVAPALENYAALLRKMEQAAEAEKLEARARAIRAKRVAGNPPK